MQVKARMGQAPKFPVVHKTGQLHTSQLASKLCLDKKTKMTR